MNTERNEGCIAFDRFVIASRDAPELPHVIVEPCRMYCGGRDLILEKALELINPSG